ncbi:MAG TPA: VIT1/CCC1 transporter family protein [Pseudomonadales bacterium]|jgi:VIT1/CCC1 family predicted Fe2+/Mn2+ transporter|nr:VIT1/CCC1 transporter family protein [Pseudomonadales bacterium]
MISSISLPLATRHLEPGESLSELLFGLIMTLTFTLGAGLMVQEGPDAVSDLLVATIGCNIAWGIIDGVFYINGQVFERARIARLGRMIRAARNEDEAAIVVERELAEIIELTVDAGERGELYRRMARQVRAATSRTRPVTLVPSDFKGALASFWLVFVGSIPAALPFLMIDDAWIALRVSNAILLGLLFFAGFRWARHTVLPPLRTGLLFLAAGVALVAVAIALGG